MHRKPSSFLKLPEYPGGKEQFKQFIRKHLKYPQEAFNNKIEGVVLLSADISDNGVVSNIKVDKGIGYGCDEEAIRVLSMMKFGGVNNHRVRVKTRKKFKIPFKLPKKQSKKVSYTLKKESIQPQMKKSESYTYTINFKK